MGKWEKSETYYELIGFINAVSVAVQGKRNSDKMEATGAIDGLLKVLKELNKLVDETPPIDQPQRFGNKAYRDWFKKMTESSVPLVKGILPENLHGAAEEIAVYLSESFGNSVRIDYGTGHELSFILFLMGLFKIGFLAETEKCAVAIRVFNEYIVFARRLQQIYRMEPAGSQGVWSLDDYQFIPFIWGSAQLAVNNPIEPSQFPEPNIVDRYKDEYMFIGCIDYILKVKVGLFAEHSNQLWSISAVPAWSKISQGLVKMYQKEMLSKFPIIQHVLFGSLFTLKPVSSGKLLPNARLGVGLGSMAAPGIVPHAPKH